jgi:uncharacterized membrane protein YbhN (UPF0104 family)
VLISGIAVALVVWLLPGAAGTTWDAIGRVVASLAPAEAALLVALWVLGLYAQSFVLTAGLPGLSNLRAMTLNLTGSAVSNVLPLGGAVGVALNYTMIRAWGFSRTGFGLFTAVTNVWDVSAKLCLPVVALTVLVAQGRVGDPKLVLAAGIAALMLLLLVGTAATALSSPRVASRVGLLAERAGNRVLRVVKPGRSVAVHEVLVEARQRAVVLVRSSWRQLSLAIVSYVAMLYLLLWTCTQLLGTGLTPTAVLAGFALERTLTLLVVTPAGAGLAETGAVAVLVALGGDPAASAASVLVYRGLILGMEVPVGAVGIVAWFTARRVRANRDRREARGA